jgi:ubiquinone biosynthesis protein
LSSNSPSIVGVAVRDLARLRTVATTVAKHGFGELVMRTPLGNRVFAGKAAPDRDPELRGRSAPERFTAMLSSLGPTYIKLGQILSMRRDLFSAEWIEALESLQDDAPKVPFADIRAQVESGLGKPLEELFRSFEEKPLATASMAQTHIATTLEGTRVVVKVQRPGIEDAMRGDLDLLFLSAQILESSIDEMQLVAVTDIVREFERGLLEELDFGVELENLVAMKANLDPARPIVVPSPFPELSAKTVLTMELFEGKALRHLEPKSERAKRAVEEILVSGAKQVLIDRLFHGDPHAGNILIGEDDTICMIDLGMVGRLTERQRDDIVTLAMAAIVNDSGTVARTLLRMGTPTERVSLEELKREIERIRGEYLVVANLSEVDSAGFAEEFAQAAGRFRIKLAPEYAILVKSVATLEGIVRTLHPEVDLVGILKPTLTKLVADRFSPQRLAGELAGEATGLAASLRTLPAHLDQLLHDFETGNIRVRAVTPELDDLPKLVHQASGKVGLALFATSTTLAAAMIAPNVGADFVSALPSLLVGFISAGAWVTLFGWHVFGRGKPLRVSPIIRLFRR